MLKKWFTPAEEVAPINRPQLRAVDRTPAAAAPAEDTAGPRVSTTSTTASVINIGAGKYSSFDQIYQNAAAKLPRISYTIMKVADMVNSEHLATLSPEATRCSLLMALEAAGVAVEDVLQDAVIRQRALADYEQTQKDRLKTFEQGKADENTKIQAELDRLTAAHNARIQANIDEVVREQESFRAWQKSKQEESQRITEAAAFCVPQGSAIGVNSLAGVLERATLVRQ